MRTLRKILKFCVIISILLWTLGFLLGSSVTLTWALASIAAYVAPISGVTFLIMMIAGLGQTQQALRRKAGETLKCIECGRPSVPGSKYCRYHLDILKEEENRETY